MLQDRPDAPPPPNQGFPCGSADDKGCHPAGRARAPFIPKTPQVCSQVDCPWPSARPVIPAQNGCWADGGRQKRLRRNERSPQRAHPPPPRPHLHKRRPKCVTWRPLGGVCAPRPSRPLQLGSNGRVDRSTHVEHATCPQRRPRHELRGCVWLGGAGARKGTSLSLLTAAPPFLAGGCASETEGCCRGGGLFRDGSDI